MSRLKMLFAVFVFGLLSISSARAVTVYYQPTPLPPGIPESNYHIRDGWVNNYYPAIKTFQDVSEFKIGGYGDSYLSLLKLDDEGLPKEVLNAYLFLYSLPRNGANPSQVALYPATSSWNTAVQWGNPSVSGVLEPYSSTLPSTLPSLAPGYSYSPPPAENTFYGMWITPFYNNWRSKISPNHGLVIYPNDGNNYQFNYFVSSNNVNDGMRPILRLDFTPSLNLKLPFDGTNGKKWRVTTEIGGIRCDGMHSGHQGTGYFSIDFSGKAKGPDGTLVTNPAVADVPIIAAAGGRVISVVSNIVVDSNPADGYGNSVVIEHGTTGITTRYSHIKPGSVNPSLVAGTTVVSQGTFLGHMGNTGWSEGVHLDFSLRYQGSATKDQGPLARIVMEGQILKSYQVDKCSGLETAQRFYPSSNVMIP